MNKIKILFFASYRDRAGLRETFLEVSDDTDINGLKSILIENFPGLKDTLPTGLVAVNKEFAFNEDVIPFGAEVAIFPPVSGGSN